VTGHYAAIAVIVISTWALWGAFATVWPPRWRRILRQLEHGHGVAGRDIPLGLATKYPTMAAMEDRKLITSTAQPDGGRLYRITGAGRAWLAMKDRP
jgi:hypothetical protein